MLRKRGVLLDARRRTCGGYLHVRLFLCGVRGINRAWWCASENIILWVQRGIGWGSAARGGGIEIYLSGVRVLVAVLFVHLLRSCLAK